MNLGFKKLDVLKENISKNRAIFYFSPLERGYGNTFGNDLRRVLLASIPGTSIIGVRIDGENHEFKRIDGTAVDGTEIVSNLKEMKFSFDDESVELLFEENKPGTYYAKDIKLPKGVVCLTPDVELVKLTGEKKVTMKIFAKKGRGYVDANSHPEFHVEGFEDVIRVDGTFSPVVNVSKRVEGIRVGQDTNYEKLTLDVETNGAISPEEAVALAGKIIRSLLSFIDDMKDFVDEYDMYEVEKQRENEILESPIEELDLTVRPYNCLKKAGYHTIGKVLNLTVTQLGAIEQLGKNSIKEIIEKLAERGYKLKEE